MSYRFLPLSIRLETVGGVATPLALRGTPLPVKRSQTFSTAEDNQSVVEISLWMGESPLTTNDIEVGKFRLEGIKLAKAGEPQIKVEFDIDRLLTIRVRATVQGSNLTAEHELPPLTTLNDALIQQLLAKSTASRAADEAALREIELANRANSLIARAEGKLATENNSKISECVATLGLALSSGDSSRIRQQSDTLEYLLTHSAEAELSTIFSSFFDPRPTQTARSKTQAKKTEQTPKTSARTQQIATISRGLVLGKIFGGGSYTLDSQLCFVLMPFSDSLRPLYDDHIKPIVEKAGMRCVRADDVHGPNLITHDIWEHINRSRFLIAELTKQNPNVFYELGLAHALSKDVVLLTETLDSVPFDLKPLRSVVYDFTPRGVKSLEQKLAAAIQAIIEDG